MKTLCFSLGLLLFVVCCSDAMPFGVSASTGPGQCCFDFKNIPPQKIVKDIIQTHRLCSKNAFIVIPVKGKPICMKDDVEWVKELFNLKTSAGSN